MWTDTHHELALYYGAVDSPDQAYTNRRTKVLDANGTLVIEYTHSVVAGAHPMEVLEDLRAMAGG